MTPLSDRQHGYTLIETMVGVLVAGAILGVIATVMSRVIASNTEAADHLRGLVALGDLGEHFRRDVHAATHAAVADDNGRPARLALTLSDGSQVTYTSTAARMDRARSVDGKVASHDSFALESLRFVEFRAGPAREVAIVMARATRAGGEDWRTSGRFTITAIRRGGAAQGAEP
jgi:type II secretory pathway pseudopilin PulG